MKKIFKLIIITSVLFALAACTTNKKDEETTNTLKVVATLDPHSKILEFAKPILKEKYDIDLIIEVVDDYYIPNKALDAKEADANYFQHVPFFETQKKENNYQIENVGGIHIEPFGFYSKTLSSSKDLKGNEKIIISNSVSDQGRILSILEKEGLISIKEGVDKISATLNDIDKNELNLQFVEVKPELLTTAFENNEGDLVAINGNYAIQAGLNPVKDAIILEQADSSNPYVNIVASRTDNKDDPKIKALVEVLKSSEVKDFISTTYSDGSVISAE